MKNYFFLSPLAVLVLLWLTASSVQAQDTVTYDTTVSVVIKDFSEDCGEDAGDAIFCLTDTAGNVITERYSCRYDNLTWRVQPQDLIGENWVLNPKYKGRKAILQCTKHPGGAGWIVEKVEFLD